MSVSIIIPVYKTEHLLERCLQSISGKSKNDTIDLEIIVINDASPGPCEPIVSKFIKNGVNIKYIEHPENKGVYNSRQTGVSLSTKKYIAFLDSDDYASPSMYAKLYHSAIKHGAEIAECSFVKIHSDGSKIQKKIKTVFLENFDIFAGLYNLDGYCPLQHHEIWNKIFSRELWDRSEKYFPILGPQDDGCEDLIRVSILYYLAKSYIGISDKLYFYNAVDTESQSKSNNPAKVLRYIYGIDNVISILKQIIISYEEKRFTIEQLIYQKLWIDIFSLFVRTNNVIPTNDRDQLLDIFNEKIGNSFFLVLKKQVPTLNKNQNTSDLLNDYYEFITCREKKISEKSLKELVLYIEKTLKKNQISNYSFRQKAVTLIKKIINTK